MSTIKARPQPQVDPQYNFSIDPNAPKRILAFSGKLGSGKTSCANFLHALAMVHVLRLTKSAFVSDKGKLITMADDGETFVELDLRSTDPTLKAVLAEKVHPFIKLFSTAEPLKNICVDLLRLDPALVWGSQEDKKVLTHLKWENMPGVISPLSFELMQHKFMYKQDEDQFIDNFLVKEGYMNVREVLEYVGTEIFRKMYPDCHANALKAMLQKSNSLYCVIDDIRYINEVKAIQSIGGLVVRLTKTSEEAAANKHTSNIELDSYTGFDYVLDNEHMEMDVAFGNLLGYMTEAGWFRIVE